MQAVLSILFDRNSTEFQQPARKWGGEITYECKNMPCFNAILSHAAIEALAADARIENLDVDVLHTDDATGTHITSGHQIAQFYSQGYDGENIGLGNDITGAVIESGEVHDNHVAFNDCGACSDRIRAIYDCNSSSCSSAIFTNPDSHSTWVHGIVLSDMTDGQGNSSNPLANVLAPARSGVSREGRIYSYNVTSAASTKREAMDHVISRANLPYAVNMSWSENNDDPECKGRTGLNKDTNDLFEYGLLAVKSAGNNGTGTGSGDCTIGSPGSAIGVFTVGALGQSTTDTNVATSVIRPSSSRGGTSSEGFDRSIIDLTAFGCRTGLLDTNGGFSESSCSTSAATPVVTGAIMNYVDAYKHEVGDLIDEPGVRFASMLLMGDRHSASGRMTSRYVNRYGAGRLQMRMPGPEGMDSPYGSHWGYTCVDDNERVSIHLNGGNPLSTDVDDVKVVIYWFDPRHEKGKSVSDIDLFLKKETGTNGIFTTYTTLRSSTDAYDNKERVFKSGVGGDILKFEIYGYDVRTDTVGCGSNSMKVYYAYFYEDDDRDDGNGPSADVRPE